MICKIHDEEAGERRPAVARDPDFGPICAECALELSVTRASERSDDSKYAHACGYWD